MLITSNFELLDLGGLTQAKVPLHSSALCLYGDFEELVIVEDVHASRNERETELN